MKKKTINLNIRIEPHIKEKAQKLALEKKMTLTELIESYIVSDYALKSLFNNYGEESNNDNQGEG